MKICLKISDPMGPPDVTFKWVTCSAFNNFATTRDSYSFDPFRRLSGSRRSGHFAALQIDLGEQLICSSLNKIIFKLHVLETFV